jgi:hypothetical protein
MSLYGRNSAEMRRTYIDWHFLPTARELFRGRPDVDTVFLACAQYWNDEALDAVHLREEPAQPGVHTWEEWLAQERGLDVQDHPAWRAHWERREALRDAWKGAREAAGVPDDYMDNGDLIPAFAAYCREGCHQELAVWDAYALYATARRVPGGVALEVSGVEVQPWAEDVSLVGRLASGLGDWPEPHLREGPLAGAPAGLFLPGVLDEALREARVLAGRAGRALRAGAALGPSFDLELRRIRGRLEDRLADGWGLEIAAAAEEGPRAGLRVPGETTAELRKMLLERYAPVIARDLLAEHPAARSAELRWAGGIQFSLPGAERVHAERFGEPLCVEDLVEAFGELPEGALVASFVRAEGKVTLLRGPPDLPDRDRPALLPVPGGGTLGRACARLAEAGRLDWLLGELHDAHRSGARWPKWRVDGLVREGAGT